VRLDIRLVFPRHNPYVSCHGRRISFFCSSVALTKTEKRSTRDHKTSYIQEVRDAVDKYDSVYLFSYENMRSRPFKTIRLDFRNDSRIFLGKNKLLQIALGRTAEEEYQDNLRQVAKRITGGSVGLLFTSRPRNDVEQYFAQMVEPDFARAGACATKDVTVTNENLAEFPVSMMEQFRKLGMPVEIFNGKVILRDGRDIFRVCKEGEVLSAEKCKLLVHFGYKLADFRVHLVCCWKDGEFDLLDESSMSDS